MPPGRSSGGGGGSQPLPPADPDATQSGPLPEASLSSADQSAPIQSPSTWGQMAAAPPPQDYTPPPPAPATYDEWQAQQYAGGNAYNTGVDAAPTWQPMPSQAHGYDAAPQAAPLQQPRSFVAQAPYWDAGGVHRAGVGLGQGAVFTGFSAPLIPRTWDDVARLMSGPPQPNAPGGLTAFANYLAPGGGQRFLQQIENPVIYGINPYRPRPQTTPIGSPQAQAQAKATPEEVSYLTNLVYGALLPNATPFTSTDRYAGLQTAAPPPLQPFMPLIDPAVRALDAWNVPWWMRAQFRPPAAPFATQRTPTNDDWYSAWRFGNQPAQREIPNPPLPADTGYVPHDQSNPTAIPLPNPDDHDKRKIG